MRSKRGSIHFDHILPHSADITGLLKSDYENGTSFFSFMKESRAIFLTRGGNTFITSCYACWFHVFWKYDLRTYGFRVTKMELTPQY